MLHDSFGDSFGLGRGDERVQGGGLVWHLGDLSRLCKTLWATNAPKTATTEMIFFLLLGYEQAVPQAVHAVP